MIQAIIDIQGAAVQRQLKQMESIAGHTPDRLANAIGQHVTVVIKDHLINERGTSHKTATKLGARATHFYRKKSGDVQYKSVNGGAHIIMPRAGLSRAFSEYKLRPTRGRKLMTIPVHKKAYGKLPGDFSGLKWRTFAKEDVGTKTTQAGIVLGEVAKKGSKKGGTKKGQFIALFRGVRKATIPADRNLLPSSALIIDGASKGIIQYLGLLSRDK